jgi:hypothetical protein
MHAYDKRMQQFMHCDALPGEKQNSNNRMNFETLLWKKYI